MCYPPLYSKDPTREKGSPECCGFAGDQAPTVFCPHPQSCGQGGNPQDPRCFCGKKQGEKHSNFFHHSSLANTALKEAHQTSGTVHRKLKQDVETIWNSTFDMLQSYIQQHEQVTTALCLNKKHGMCLEDKDLELLRVAMATLEPFYEATVEMSAELHTSASKIIPLVHLLQECLSEDSTELGNLLWRILASSDDCTINDSFYERCRLASYQRWRSGVPLLLS